MWLFFLKGLRDYLKSTPELGCKQIYVGSDDSRNNWPYIELVRGNTSMIENNNRVKSGTFEFYIDLWVENNEMEPEPGYDTLNALEKVTVDAVYGWFKKIVTEKNLAVVAEITDLVSDVDEFRPLCASRIVVKIKYKITGGK